MNDDTSAGVGPVHQPVRPVLATMAAWMMTASAVFMSVAAIGGGSWMAAYFAGAAAWFAWDSVRARTSRPNVGIEPPRSGRLE
jgi:hypothetical protein